jgi:prepilin-type N-terminal cleavage/methylation domain-containing protein
MNCRGYTLVEMVFTALILGLVMLALSNLFQPMERYFLQLRMSQQMSSDSRVGMDIIIKSLQQGVPASLWYCSCQPPAPTATDPNPYVACFNPPCPAPDSSSSVPPNSQIEFDLPGGTTHYAIYWSSGAAVMRISLNPSAALPNGKLVFAPRVIANHVTNLNFTGDSNDPAVVTVSLQFASGNSAFFNAPSQVVHMQGSQ